MCVKENNVQSNIPRIPGVFFLVVLRYACFFFFLARGFGGEGGTLTTYLLLNTDYLTTYLFTYLPMLP